MRKNETTEFKKTIQGLKFIRPIYRALFLRGRTYAAFERHQLQAILAQLSPSGTVFDPMSGYGVLTDVCRSLGISTFSIELNPPSYLWQVLTLPSNKEQLLLAALTLKNSAQRISTCKELEASDSWFPQESERMLKCLWDKAIATLSTQLARETAEDMLAAVILPFLGRLSSYSASGNIHIQVKEGGVVIYTDWKKDFNQYIKSIIEHINSYEESLSSHIVVFGDACTIDNISSKFSYIVTSPPYPNMKDYYAFFFPENFALENIFCIERFKFGNIRNKIIGSSSVSEFKKTHIIDYRNIYSKSAKNFLIALERWKGSKQAIYDNKSYYIPYFYSYFLNIESAYANIDKLLSRNISGYIIVINNTARKFIIPVHSFIKEIWELFGCCAKEDDLFTNERSHIGSINPRAIGFKARHMEYVIRVDRAKELPFI